MSQGPISLLAIGILSFIFGFISFILGASIINWLVDPRVLESNGSKVGLLTPKFAVDTSRNPESL